MSYDFTLFDSQTLMDVENAFVSTLSDGWDAGVELFDSALDSTTEWLFAGEDGRNALDNLGFTMGSGMGSGSSTMQSPAQSMGFGRQGGGQTSPLVEELQMNQLKDEMAAEQRQMAMNEGGTGAERGLLSGFQQYLTSKEGARDMLGGVGAMLRDREAQKQRDKEMSMLERERKRQQRRSFKRQGGGF